MANSGIQQYGQIQNRQALGGTVNQLASQNAEVARAAMDASRNVGQNLQNTLMRARLSADAQQMETDEQLYAREQQGQEQQFQRTLQAMEAFGISPDNPQYEQIMQSLFGDQLDPAIQKQLEGATALGDIGGEGYAQSRTGAGKAADFLSTFGLGGIGLGYMAGNAIQNLFRTKDNQLDTNLSRTIAGQGKNTYYIDGQKQSLTKDELKAYVDNKYANMEGYGSQIVFKASNTGGKFWYNGKGYKTYNEARNAMKGI